MALHSDRSLASPIAQIDAAEQFCGSLVSFFADEYEEIHGEPPPDVDEIHPLNVLDALARLGLRFETDGMDIEKGEHGFFLIASADNSTLGSCLYAYAKLVADKFTENGFIVYEGEGGIYEVPPNRPSVLDMITLYGCSWGNLVFVPDFEHVVSPAYFLLLSPGRMPFEESS